MTGSRNEGLRRCIVTCSPGKTLALAESLTEAGFDAWTPAEIVDRRSRSGDKPEPVRVPLLASYVFVTADRLQDLIALSHSPSLNYQVWDTDLRRMVTKGHPFFHIFRPFGSIEIVPDRQLAYLRSLERRTQPKPVAKVFDRGDRVRLTEAGFEGLRATVETSRKTYTQVWVDGSNWPHTFPTWSLQAELDDTPGVHVNAVSTEQAQRAKAA